MNDAKKSWFDTALETVRALEPTIVQDKDCQDVVIAATQNITKDFTKALAILVASNTPDVDGARRHFQGEIIGTIGRVLTIGVAYGRHQCEEAHRAAQDALATAATKEDGQ